MQLTPPSDLASVPLIRLDNYEKEIRRQVRIAIFHCESDRSRLGQLQRLFYQSLITVSYWPSQPPHAIKHL